MNIKVGDIVKVLYAPPRCVTNWPSMIGYAGVVQEVHERIGRVLVQTFTNDGSEHRLAFIDAKALEVIWTTDGASQQLKPEKEQSDHE